MSPGAFSERGRAPADGWRSPIAHSRGTSARSVTPKRAALVPASPAMESIDDASSGSIRELAFRREFGDKGEGSATVPPSSFGQHRQQKSLSKELFSLRNCQQSDPSPDLDTLGQATAVYHPLETVNEVASAANTPVWPLTALKLDEEHLRDESRLLLDLEKRLPTLPNTPSSAYAPSMADDHVEHHESEGIKDLTSHFSCTTVDTEPRTESYLHNDNSRFSDWTEAPIRLSPQSDYASSFLDFEPISPPPELTSDFEPNNLEHQEDSKHAGLTVFKEDSLPSASSFSTVTSVASSAPSTHDDLESAKSGHFSWSKFQHYSLPSEEAGSGITLKPTSTTQPATPLVVGNHHSDAYESRVIGGQQPTIPHSSSMQELLEELSYLGGMIQQH